MSDSSLHIRDEAERELLFRDKFHHPTRIHQDSGEAALRLQMVLWATFTAKYLPSLVDRILDLPPHSARSVEHYGLQNIYHTALKFVDIAYLAKFMTSGHPIAEGGKRLPMVMAERLVEYGPIWLNRDQTRPIDYDIYEGCIHKAVSTLMMLVIAAKGQVIPDTTKTRLVWWLDIWAAYDSWFYMAPGDNMPAVCSTLSNVLKYGADSWKSFVKQRRRALKCVEVCALHTCSAETNLKTCARCKTAAYCSKAHQTSHWKHTVAPHKTRCYETDY